MDIEGVRIAIFIGMLLIVVVILMPDKFDKPEDPPWVKRESDDEHSKHDPSEDQ